MFISNFYIKSQEAVTLSNLTLTSFFNFIFPFFKPIKVVSPLKSTSNCSYILRLAILINFFEPLGSSRNCLESIEIFVYVPSLGNSLSVFMLEQ